VEISGPHELFQPFGSSESQYLVFTVRLDFGKKGVCEVLGFFLEYSYRFFGLHIFNAMHLHLCIATSASPFPVSSALLKLLHSLVENSEYWK